LASGPASDTGRDIADALTGHPAAPPRLLGIDGRSGSGKSWLAAKVSQCLDQAGVRHSMVVMDDLYAGWDGLAGALPTLRAQVIDPLRDGEPAGYRRYDWQLEAFAEHVDVPAADVVVIEGVGSTCHQSRDALALTVWVQAPARVRHQRACARTGQGDFAAHARTWAHAENALFGPDEYPLPPDRFDLVVDTATHAEPSRG